MSSTTILRSAKDIDLGRHGVIEAHAGTGKTYTIIQTVLRILEKQVTTANDEKAFISIRDIMLVTFTEKAAGELKRRIRKGLEDRILSLDEKKNGELISHLKTCLNNSHEAYIGTIHSVCLRLLQTWPFETGVPFKTEMVDDSDGIVDALRESMRTDWQEDGTLIPWGLEQLKAQRTQLEEKHFGLVRDTAVKLLDEDTTMLDRRACGGYTLGELHRKLDTINKEVNDKGTIKEFRKAVESLIAGLNQAKSSGTMEPDRVEKLDIRIAQLQAMCRSNQYDTKILTAPCNSGRGKIFLKPDYKKVPGLDRIDQQCKTIFDHPYLAILNQKQEISGFLLLTLLCDAAVLLRDRWIRTKREKGLISFQGMLRLMHNAVFGNSAFCDSLRRRLRYGIIDEFQDTSILQWEIFKRIFLETSDENGPRLFIVGDPKQSIFAFQGADVQSYLDAKNTIEKKNVNVVPLTENYRSLKETIDGYNAIFAREGSGPDWFAFDENAKTGGRISYPSESDGGKTVKAADRSPEHPFNGALGQPVQVMVLEGSAPARVRKMAKRTGMAIRKLLGGKIRVPDGAGWKELTLKYEHFAVIVEKHRLAVPFLEAFEEEGIPAVKYKMEGVFQSPVARDLHALLRAILHPAGDPAPRLAALLTRFFNRDPADLDPEKDLEPCTNPFECSKKGHSCISYALEEWTYLASKQLWSRLFKSIQERTGVRERMIRWTDGKRCLADLRQVIDYAIEKLYRGNYGLEQLVDHLGRLLAEEENVGQDENLHMLATGKPCVKVLTMHAAKGLEFPVVFVVTGGSDKYREPWSPLCWMDGHRQMVMPSGSFAQGLLKELFNEEDLSKIPVNLQDKQERRRLLYVALTRAQARLFVPAHVDSINPNDAGTWQERCRLPEKSPDDDLTPKLLQLLDSKEIDLFNETKWNSATPENGAQTGEAASSSPAVPDRADIATLDLLSRICRQTSYTELSREATADRAVDHSEEVDEPEKEIQQRPDLPGGSKTGDALHLALEKMLGAVDMTALINDTPAVNALVRKYLERNRVLENLDHDDKRNRAVDAGVEYIRGALIAPLPLPLGGTVKITGLKPSDRIPEMEFQLGVFPHWVHGFMDLVFRVENKNAKHPWRYFVLDWKSDQLDTFDEQSVKTCIEERHYKLQAQVYCHALDKYLSGILGEQYDPKSNLGGAVYVFLRSFQNTLPNDICHAWTLPASPKEDSKFTKDQINNLIRRGSDRA